MTKAEVVALLTPINPKRSPAEIAVYAAAFVEWEVAQRNIDEHGTLVNHPRTGAPVENPYGDIRDKRAKLMLGLDLRTGDLWTRGG